MFSNYLMPAQVVNSIEFPACRKGEARFRLQVSSRQDDQKILDWQ